MLQIETYTVPREGAKLTSGVDGRVSFDIKPHFFKFPSQVELEVNHISYLLMKTCIHLYKDNSLISFDILYEFEFPDSIMLTGTACR